MALSAKPKNFLLMNTPALSPAPFPLLHAPCYLMTLSALASTFGGIVRPICLAAFRLMTSSNFFGRSTGSLRVSAFQNLVDHRRESNFNCPYPRPQLARRHKLQALNKRLIFSLQRVRGWPVSINVSLNETDPNKVDLRSGRMSAHDVTGKIHYKRYGGRLDTASFFDYRVECDAIRAQSAVYRNV